MKIKKNKNGFYEIDDKAETIIAVLTSSILMILIITVAIILL